MEKNNLLQDIDKALASDEIADSTKKLLNEYRKELCRTLSKERYIEIVLRLIQLLTVCYDIYSKLE